MNASNLIRSKHGKTKTKIYRIWKSMRTRINNKNYHSYHRYGGRGLKIDPRWDNFTNFYTDMGEPKKWQTLDRIDNNLGYFKENCRWTDMKEQSKNRHTSNKILFDGKIWTIIDICKTYNISTTHIYRRIKEGYSIKDIILKKIPHKINSRYRILSFNGESRTITEWAKFLNISIQTISTRIRSGHPIEKILSKKRLK